LEHTGAWRCGDFEFGSYKIPKIGVSYDDLVDSGLTVKPEHMKDGPWRLHERVTKEKITINCLLTPSTTKEGRDMPKSRIEELDAYPQEVLDRWRADNKRYAPWLYYKKNLAWSESGDWRVFTSRIREMVKGLPIDHTRHGRVATNNDHTQTTMVQEIEEDDRAKYLANAWHGSISMFWAQMVRALNEERRSPDYVTNTLWSSSFE
jgi:hypothetical protein